MKRKGGKGKPAGRGSGGGAAGASIHKGRGKSAGAGGAKHGGGGGGGGKSKKRHYPPAKKVAEAAKTVLGMPGREKPTNSNWELLKGTLSSGKTGGKAGGAKPFRRGKPAAKATGAGAGEDGFARGKFAPQARRENKQETRIVSLDCEMVGVGEGGTKSALARVVIVNYYGNVLVDSYCKPKLRVTDYRTRVSGINAFHLKGAPSFDVVQKEVQDVSKAVNPSATNSPPHPPTIASPTGSGESRGRVDPPTCAFARVCVFSRGSVRADFDSRPLHFFLIFSSCSLSVSLCSC